MRLMFYSYDRRGLGHLRRTLSLASGLRDFIPALEAVVVTGSPGLQAVAIPDGVEIVKLPSLMKTNSGSYTSPTLTVAAHELSALRSRIVSEVLHCFQPRFLLVDTPPWEQIGELGSVLRDLRTEGYGTAILGLRDVLDEPPRVLKLWKSHNIFEWIDRNFSRIMVFGAPAVYDLVTQYRFPHHIASKVQYCGYFPRPYQSDTDSEQLLPCSADVKSLVLMTVGGGRDGWKAADAFMRSFANLADDLDLSGVLVTGPEMPPREVAKLRAQGLPSQRLKVVRSEPNILSLFKRARLVLSMAGYNTLNEILWFQKNAIVVPRVRPGLEQLIRAKRFEALGLVEVVAPAALSVEALTQRIRAAMKRRTLLGPSPLEFEAPRVVAEYLLSQQVPTTALLRRRTSFDE